MATKDDLPDLADSQTRVDLMTARNAEFVAAYLETGSRREAAAAVGITDKQADNLLRTAAIVQTIAQAYEKVGLTADLVASRIREALDAERVTVVALGEGMMHREVSPDHQIRLSAAKLALDQAGKWVDRQIREDELAALAARKPAQEMTLEELSRAVAQQTLKESVV